jgi:hypothetical protein
MCDPSALRLGTAKPLGSCPSLGIQGAILVARGCTGGIAPAQQLLSRLQPEDRLAGNHQLQIVALQL